MPFADKRRRRFCFAQPMPNAGRYQLWLECLTEHYRTYAVRYNDFGSVNPSVDDSLACRIWHKLGRMLNEVRLVPSILWADTVIVCNMGVKQRLYKIAEILNKEIILDMYISEYQTQVESRRLVARGSRRARDLYRQERYRLSHASKVVFLTHEEIDLYCGLLKTNPRKTYVLPLGNTDKPRASIAYFHGERSRPSICWWGGECNPIHGLDVIVRGLKLLEEKGVAFEFTILGVDPVVGERFYGNILESVGWRERVATKYLMGDSDAFVSFLRDHCDIGFGPMSTEPKALSVVSNKALDCLNMGIPLVQIDSPEVRQTWSDEEVFFCSEANPDAVCEAVERVLSDGEVLHRVERARNLYEKTRSPYVLKKQLLDIVSSED